MGMGWQLLNSFSMLRNSGRTFVLILFFPTIFGTNDFFPTKSEVKW